MNYNESISRRNRNGGSIKEVVMCCFECLNEKIKKLTFCDISIMKICIIAFTLLVVKFWPAATSLDWPWYAGVFAVTYGFLLYKLFVKK